MVTQCCTFYITNKTSLQTNLQHLQENSGGFKTIAPKIGKAWKERKERPFMQNNKYFVLQCRNQTIIYDSLQRSGSPVKNSNNSK